MFENSLNMAKCGGTRQVRSDKRLNTIVTADLDQIFGNEEHFFKYSSENFDSLHATYKQK